MWGLHILPYMSSSPPLAIIGRRKVFYSDCMSWRRRSGEAVLSLSEGEPPSYQVDWMASLYGSQWLIVGEVLGGKDPLDECCGCLHGRPGRLAA
jgi:hypothetical protein